MLIINVKMAASAPLVLCDALCFMRNKYGRVPAKELKSVIMDFCTVGHVRVMSL